MTDSPALPARGKDAILARYRPRRLDDLPLTMLQPSTKVEHLLIFEFVPKAPEIARGAGNGERR